MQKRICGLFLLLIVLVISSCEKEQMMQVQSGWSFPKGSIFVGDVGGNSGTGNIYVITPDGNRINLTEPAPHFVPTSLEFDKNGNLLFPNFHTTEILKLAANGILDTFAQGPRFQLDLVFDQNGNIYTSSYFAGEILKHTPDGARSVFATGMNGPAGLAFDRNNNLYVAEEVTGNIFRFTPSGSRELFVEGLSHPNDIVFDQNGNLFETDQGSGKIMMITPNGVVSTFATGLSDVAGLTFSEDGNLFVADLDGHIYKFAPNGVRSTVAENLPAPYSLAFAPSSGEPPVLSVYCRIESIWENPFAADQRFIQVLYDEFENPIAITTPEPTTGHPYRTFNYDAWHRLREYRGEYSNGNYEFWHFYGYDLDGRIGVDTMYVLGAMGPTGPATYFERTISKITYDDQGRIVKVVADQQLSPLHTETNYAYDGAGNLVVPGVFYDNKTNLYRTNNIWQFLNRDYSMNNPFTATSYNATNYPTAINSATPILFLNELQLHHSQIGYGCRQHQW